MRLSFSIVLMIILWSCSNDSKEVDTVLGKHTFKQEIAEDVIILYSDSAEVKVRITSPLLKRYDLRGESYDEFPNGLLVEFLDKHKEVKSWLEADYAVRKDNDKKIFVENNVRLYNKRDDQLLTDELIWDEKTEELYTNKAVKIVQSSVGDTSFGFGFRADQEFSRFEIQRKFSAIKNIEELEETLEK